MIDRRKLHRAARRTRKILKNVPFWCALFLIFFRHSFSTEGAFFDYLENQYLLNKPDLQHVLMSMTEFAAAWPPADAVLSFHRYGVAMVIGLSAKLLLIIYSTAFVAALGLEYYSSDRSRAADETETPDSPWQRLRSGIISFVIVVFLAIVYFWIAHSEECLISGEVEMRCAGTIPTLLAYCVVFAAVVELGLVPFKRSARPFDRLLRVFD